MASGIQKKIREANKVNDGLSGRMDVAEKNIQAMHENYQKNFAIVEQKFNQMEEFIDALITEMGTDKVFEIIKTKRIEKQEADAAAKKVALEAALKEGQVVVAETVGDTSVIIGTEVDKDGNQLYPTRAQILFAQVKPELAEPMRGKKVGDVVVTPVETRFTINEIYNIIVPTKAETAPVEAELLGPPSDPVSPEVEQALINDLSASDGTVN